MLASVFRSVGWAMAVIGSVVMSAAGVSPTEAQLNIASWADAIGIGKIPELLTTVSSDVYFYYGGSAVALCSLIALLAESLHRRLKRRGDTAMERKAGGLG